MSLTKNNLAVRGQVLTGIVTSAKAPKTVTVMRTITHFVSKYERYKSVKSKIKAHVPEKMIVAEGDTVQVGETRKLSKTKNFVVMKIVKKGTAVEKRHVLDAEELQESMHAKAEKKEEKPEEKNDESD